MPKFMPRPEHAPEPTPLTANRQALADLNEARAASKATVAELQERLNRLADLKAAVAPLEAEIQALDAAEADALAQWSATPDAPAPESDVTARAAILVRLQSARHRVASAEQATASVGHVLNTANARYADLERQVPALVAAVLVDEARSLLPPIVEAIMALAKAQGRYASLRKFLLERAEAAKDVASRNGFFHDLERLDRKAADAASIAPLLSFDAGAEWKAMAAALGDVPIRPTPTLPAAFHDMPEMKW
jgi:chromosome segregation ATPase